MEFKQYKYAIPCAFLNNPHFTYNPHQQARFKLCREIQTQLLPKVPHYSAQTVPINYAQTVFKLWLQCAQTVPWLSVKGPKRCFVGA